MEISIPYFIAITGGIGCGKTTVCDILRKKGYIVFDADCYSVEVIKTQTKVHHKLKELLHNVSIFDENRLDFKAIGSFFNQNPKVEIEFEQWYQPILGQLIKNELLKFQEYDIVYVDIPHISEKKIFSFFNEIWIITANAELQKKRIMNRNCYDVKKIEILLNRCIDEIQLSSKITFIENTGSINHLKELVDKEICMTNLNCSVAKTMHSIASSHLVTSPCPDIIVGKIRSGIWELWASADKREKSNVNFEITNSADEKTIVIILESPHTEEFIDTALKKQSIKFYNAKGVSSSPAMSLTGDNLQKYLEKILNEKLETKVTYRIILMNSIQYQCSLGQNTKKWRDHVWLKLWFDKKMNADFIERLKRYNPDIIINCCTKFDHSLEPRLPGRTKTVLNNIYLEHCIKTKNVQGSSLNEFVQAEINDSGITAERYICSHPSSWSRKKAVLEKVN